MVEILGGSGGMVELENEKLETKRRKLEEDRRRKEENKLGNSTQISPQHQGEVRD